MPIKESSFRIGCGRYVQEENLLSRAGAEIARLGRRPLIVGDDTAVGIVRGALIPSVEASCEKYEIVIHNGTCNDERATEIGEMARSDGYDVIVGVGGGVIMDFAKLCGYFAKMPVVNIPTSAATCAAYTPLSVRYTPEGKTVGTLHYGYEVDAVLVDMNVMLAQPTRLLLAGVFDALAKFVEIKQRFHPDSEDVFPMGLDYACVLAERTFRMLCRDIEGCIADMKAGQVTPRVENVIFTLIAVTGVISGIARGSNQTALGHKFYENTRYLFPDTARPYLHGEIVGIGLLLQNEFNGERDQNDFLLGLMRTYNMPASVAAIGITHDEATRETYYERLCQSSAMEDSGESEYARLKAALQYLWEVS
jgi:glycerol dehydrogenase